VSPQEERRSGVRRALLSLTDKTGLLEFAQGLQARDFELVASGGTARALREAGLAVTEVADVTGFPEMLDGRIKTLHPGVHGGLLARRDLPAHLAALQQHGIGTIDVLAVNLYAFREASAAPGATEEHIVENIDIGGPAMIRSAAKNHHAVWVAVDPADYAAVLAGLDAEKNGKPGLGERRRLAAKAYRVTAAYDAAISQWFATRLGELPGPGVPGPQELRWPESYVLEGGAGRGLRYGENPQQRAAFFVQRGKEPCVARSRVLHGKELSYNNILDADAALELVKEFSEPAAAVIKHNNPCGCAVGRDLLEAWGAALAGDPQSAFGGIAAFNRPVDASLATLIATPDNFLEVIVAPDFGADALYLISSGVKWGKNVRLIACGPLGADPDRTDLVVRKVVGGFLVQDRDLGFAREKRDIVTERAPRDAERKDLEFAWRVCKHVKSNAIVLVKDGAVVGVGAGQMSRVDSVLIAIDKAGPRAKGAVLASDAFFPFRDSLDEAAAAGVTAVIQPGGSIRDPESIEACNETGMAMVVTGARHFRH
jgi:phosphoribosylaminoimidazolecarboxamide formyltransferase/IMP cyclohydrolase